MDQKQFEQNVKQAQQQQKKQEYNYLKKGNIRTKKTITSTMYDSWSKRKMYEYFYDK